MSKYTFMLKDLFLSNKFAPPLYTRKEVESWFSDYNLEDFLTQEQISQIMKFGVWSKEKLAKKIVDHFYFRESAYETPRYVRTLCKSYHERNYGKIFTLHLF